MSQRTPVTRGVLMRVLQLTWAHCCSCVRMLVFWVGAEDWRFASARRRAHSPALAHWWAVSVRWSRQNLLQWCVNDYCLERGLEVLDTHLPFAALTFEGEEVELATEGHLAVRPNRLDVSNTHFLVTCF